MVITVLDGVRTTLLRTALRRVQLFTDLGLCVGTDETSLPQKNAILDPVVVASEIPVRFASAPIVKVRSIAPSREMLKRVFHKDFETKRKQGLLTDWARSLLSVSLLSIQTRGPWRGSS